jgi:hypothetical protein
MKEQIGWWILIGAEVLKYVMLLSLIGAGIAGVAYVVLMTLEAVL